MLNDEAFTGTEVVNLETKLPTISILNVEKFTSEEDFIDRVKKQNPGIKEKMDNGSKFSIVYSRKPKEGEDAKKYYQLIARVSEDIRMVIKESNDKIYTDLVSHHVVDRFYIKRCNRCKKYGHYEKDCEFDPCCGYCRKPHLSSECEEVAPGDYKHYDCANCKEGGKQPMGHSSHWHKCPTYLELQQKLKNSIPFYHSKNWK